MRLINPEFDKELKKYGAEVATLCFNCGTCSAICPLVSDGFPRKYIRYVQIGAQDKILMDYNDLWKCLHCGLCTYTCPRGADPGEVMLGLKRFVLDKLRGGQNV